MLTFSIEALGLSLRPIASSPQSDRRRPSLSYSTATQATGLRFFAYRHAHCHACIESICKVLKTRDAKGIGFGASVGGFKTRFKREQNHLASVCRINQSIVH